MSDPRGTDDARGENRALRTRASIPYAGEERKTDQQQQAEDVFMGRIERAKEILRIEAAVLRAVAEGRSTAETVITWADGSRVSRITVWRLKVHLELISGRYNGTNTGKRTGRRDTKRALQVARP